jgi:hypothetical protein
MWFGGWVHVYVWIEDSYGTNQGGPHDQNVLKGCMIDQENL